jgi:RNA polymerase-interacting CarD/CdnL/TRCF family regulator
MLEVGESVRYHNLGAGTVVEHIERDFQGSSREFAVIFFPHKNMNAQLPIGDPKINKKIFKVSSKEEVNQWIDNLIDYAYKLPRTWDVREQEGLRALQSNEPEDWVRLLSAYAYADGLGVNVAASDGELVTGAEELIAAELCCSCGLEYPEAIKRVREAYKEAGEQAQKRSQVVENFAAVEI